MTLSKQDVQRLKLAAIVDKRLSLHQKVEKAIMAQCNYILQPDASRLAYQLVCTLLTPAEFELIDRLFTVPTKY